MFPRITFLLVLLAVLLFFEFYAYQAIKTLLKSKILLNGYKIFSLIWIIIVLYGFNQFDRSKGQTIGNMYTVGVLLVFLVPKMVLTFTMFSEDVFRVFAGVFSRLSSTQESESFFASRRKFVSQIGLGIAAVPFLGMLYGVFVGRYNYKVIHQTLFFDDLPTNFDGFKITQISDVHSGSFDNPEKINYAIDLINEQEADIILFTGDIVNNVAEEMHPWIETFKKIKNYEFGKYSVLGNHDYGEYLDWNSHPKGAKEKNFQEIKSLYGDINFKLLLNENIKLKKGNDEIALVGVENWGKGFKQAGDLEKASSDLQKSDFKILMSHDPSHWEMEVKDHPKHFHLTLSGHTHGMQFGIEIPGWIKWNLAQIVYKQSAGLYENVKKYIYVNRGFGYHAFPGRVGIMPEITVITLKKGKIVA